MAIVDYNYKFVNVDVGCQGRIDDGGVFRKTSYSKALENCQLNLPDPTLLSLTETGIGNKTTPQFHLC